MIRGRYRSCSRWKHLWASDPRSPCPDGLAPELQAEWRSRGSQLDHGRQSCAGQKQRARAYMMMLQHLTVFFKRAQRFPVLSSPQWEGPLLVAAQPAAVDGGRARHSVQVMRTVGQRWNPLTVPLCLLFPTNNHRHTDVKTFEIAVLSTSDYLFRDWVCVSRADCGGRTWGRRGARCWWRQLCTFHHFPQGSPRPQRPSAGSH